MCITQPHSQVLFSPISVLDICVFYYDYCLNGGGGRENVTAKKGKIVAVVVVAVGFG